MRSGKPRGPGKAFQNVGGFAPHLLGGFIGPPGPARPQRCPQKTAGQTAFRYPALKGSSIGILKSRKVDLGAKFA